MSFLMFLFFYIICTLLFLLLGFLLYKFCFKKLIISKISENAILKAFDSLEQKSILDIDLPEEKKEDNNEKIYTYF